MRLAPLSPAPAGKSLPGDILRGKDRPSCLATSASQGLRQYLSVRFLYISHAFAVIWIIAPSLVRANTAENPSTDSKHILDRLSHLQNLRVTYKITTKHTPDMDQLRQLFGPAVHPLTGTRVWEDSFSFLLDRARYTEKFLSGSPEAECAGDKFDSIWIVTPERTEELSVPLNRGRAAGAIAARGTLRDSVDLPLGLRMYGQDDWVGEKDIITGSTYS